MKMENEFCIVSITPEHRPWRNVIKVELEAVLADEIEIKALIAAFAAGKKVKLVICE